MISYAIVAFGGGLGAVSRYALTQIPFPGFWPFPTLTANLMGALIIGVLIGYGMRHEAPPLLMLGLKTGFCGGFTTFSAFSAETMSMFEAGRWLAACLYIAVSVGLCLGGVLVGKKLAIALF
ncbi:MAG: fluoride efflux transporter CrcB [Proteobacteria bacterium]|nr:fluoride efflux transporter CrcB [Pseudomonadota bacterium]